MKYKMEIFVFVAFMGTDTLTHKHTYTKRVKLKEKFYKIMKLQTFFSAQSLFKSSLLDSKQSPCVVVIKRQIFPSPFAFTNDFSM